MRAVWPVTTYSFDEILSFNEMLARIKELTEQIQCGANYKLCSKALVILLSNLPKWLLQLLHEAIIHCFKNLQINQARLLTV